MYDLLLSQGRVANAPGGISGRLDVAVESGSIAEVEADLDPADAREVVNLDGLWVIPGLIDPHVHVSGRFGSPVGHRMMVRGGVTTALDLAGDPGQLADGLRSSGCGMTMGVLFPIIPGETVASRDPSRTELQALLERQLEAGALGLKVLGGHYPVTPAAVLRAIEVCHEHGAYCAVHAGSSVTGSNIEGLEELVQLAGHLPLHVAHINSYCRGQVAEPVEEAARAVAALLRAPRARSESYLSPINGLDASCRNGSPISGVLKTCLRLGGYAETTDGLEAAIQEGWAMIHQESDGEVLLAPPEEGVDLFRRLEGHVGVSFAVNPASSAVAIALAHRPGSRDFVVGAFSSDGGSLPRNTTLRQAMGLVAAGLLSIEELVLKGSQAPASMLGLRDKGRVATGADADLVAVDRDGRCRMAVIAGRIVFRDGRFEDIGGGGLLCTPAAGPEVGRGLRRTELHPL